ALDTRGTGTISAQDLMAVLRHHLNVDQSEARFIFQRIDAGQGGEIHYSEFLAAAMSARMVIQEKQIREMFARMDTDGTGKITADNLREVHEFEAVLLDRVAHNDQTVKIARLPGEETESVEEGYDPLWEKITGQKASSFDQRAPALKPKSFADEAIGTTMEKSNTKRSRFDWEQLARLGRKLVSDRTAYDASAKRHPHSVT
ncbi:hypothetical protein FOZ62_006216, partial [Perkinsus olseni]